MKRIFIWLSSAILLTALLSVALSFGGCSKSDSDKPSENDIIGTWKARLEGDTDEDVIYVTMEIREGSSMTITTEYPKSDEDPDDEEEGSEEDDLISVVDLYWKTEGDKVLFAYIDGDENGVPDPEEDLIWEIYTYKISGSTLTLTDEWEVNEWKYIKL